MGTHNNGDVRKMTSSAWKSEAAENLENVSDVSLPLSPFTENKGLLALLKLDFVNDEAVSEYGEVNCNNNFSNILTWLCRPPCFTSLRVNTMSISTAAAQKKLQNYLNVLLGQPQFQVLEHDLRDTLIIPAVTVHERVSPIYKEVVVDLACGVAVLRGSDVYAPGIMAANPEVECGDTVSVFSDVDGKCLRGLVKPFAGRKVFVGNGVSRMARKEVFASNNPRGLAVEMTNRLFHNPSLGSAFPDIILLQNLPSIVCSHVLDPQPGEWILDMCAAPGGKTVHIATLLNNQSKIIALDKTKSKILKIQQLADKWGVTCIESYAFDATRAHDFNLPVINSDSSEPSCPPFPSNTFDRVLLDAPCSALGQRPQLNNRMTESQLKSYPPLQKKLFRVAVNLLKTGGTLVYSTCTITLAENEKLVRWALDTFSCLELVQQVSKRCQQ